jgi:carbonic anhydrase/acetyltransferase-like protein (isoleucine patch superfamily)
VAIYALGELVPSIDESAFVHPGAVVIGSVEVGPDASLWPGAVLRGDYGRIVVGARTSVQDGCVLHADRDVETVVGAGCILGHLAHLEGCVVEDDCLIGAGAVVLHRAVVGCGATVAAGAVVLEDATVPAGRLVAGVPARVVPGGWTLDQIRAGSALYVDNAKRYRDELRRID